MKKNGKLLVVCFMAVVVCLALTGCGKKKTIQNLKYNLADERAENAKLQERIAELEKELEVAKQRADSAEQKATEIKEDSAYMQLKFPIDGNYYKEANDEISFYSDSSCTIRIDNVRFMSVEMDNCTAANGLAIYVLLKDDGKPCYCPQNMGYPYLVTEQYYDEMKAKETEEVEE